MILQLLIFALLFSAFGIFSLMRRKKILGLMFLMLGFMLMVLAACVVYFYPSTLDF
jgi:hypothetical protein